MHLFSLKEKSTDLLFKNKHSLLLSPTSVWFYETSYISKKKNCSVQLLSWNILSELHFYFCFAEERLLLSFQYCLNEIYWDETKWKEIMQKKNVNKKRKCKIFQTRFKSFFHRLDKITSNKEICLILRMSSFCNRFLK